MSGEHQVAQHQVPMTTLYLLLIPVPTVKTLFLLSGPWDSMFATNMRLRPAGTEREKQKQQSRGSGPQQSMLFYGHPRPYHRFNQSEVEAQLRRLP